MDEVRSRLLALGDVVLLNQNTFSTKSLTQIGKQLPTRRGQAS